MLKNIVILNTLRCDLKCQHCLRGFPTERPDFPMDLLDKLLTEVMPFGAKHVALTGGEPHLHPEFETMVDRIVAYGYTWSFVSNGQGTEPYLPLMEKYKEKITHVALSIDGATAETHDRLRQRQGAFEKVTAAARQYVALGYSLRISASFNQKNKGEAEALVKLANDLGADAFYGLGTIPTEWNQSLVLSDAESLAIYQGLLRLRKGSKAKINIASSLHARGGVNFCANLNLRELPFNTNGELIFCCDTTENGAVIGSLREHAFGELVKGWLAVSQSLQAQRAEEIIAGRLGEKFDTCAFCNAHMMAD